MKQSGKSNLFALVCIAVLLGAYGIGLGVRRVRFGGVETQAPVASEPEESADEPAEVVAADTEAESEPSEQVQQEQSEGEEEPAFPRERPEGRRGMMGEGMRERFQNMSDEERQEMMARMRDRGGRRRGEGGGGSPFGQLSEEDRDNLRADMEELGARAGEMSEEEMREARGQIMEKYGITPGRFGGRPGGGGGGRRGGDRQ
ncbi:MAG: hypothetical protein ACYSWO_06140 [Planctomycetota bacterium]|jgi:hypothetical protein